MSRKIAALALVLMLVLTGVAVSQYYLRVSYQQQLEANYRRAFRELAVHIDGLERELAKTRVVTAHVQQVELWANIQRLVYAAQANLGQLPMGAIQLQRVESTLNVFQTRALEYTRQAFANDEFRPPISDLERLRNQASYLNAELQETVATTEQQSHWLDWKRYFTASVSHSGQIKPDALNPLLRSLLLIEDGLGQFDEGLPPRARGRSLEGEAISREEAVTLASNFLQDENSQYEVVNEGRGAIPTYTVQATTSQNAEIMLEVSQAAGKILWMTNPRPVREGNLSIEQLQRKVLEFVEARDFPPMEVLEWQYLQERATFSLAPILDDIVVYPQAINVQVAADTGEILGFYGLPYYQNSETRAKAVSMSPEEARRFLENLEVTGNEKLALISSNTGADVLTYRFAVASGEQEYLVFINAENGLQERITILP